MQPTRSTWTAVGLSVTLAAFVPVVASPIPAVGAAVLFGWLIARQVVAVKRFQATVENTTVTVEPATTAAETDDEIPVTLSAERPQAAAETDLAVSLPIPPAVTLQQESTPQVRLTAGETHAQTTVVMSVPITGRITFSAPQWELVDSHAAFTESFGRGPTPTLTISAPALREMHVGRGGQELSAFGEHLTERSGDGLTPAELRQYTDGDPADRIDWKATARLREAFTREFESEDDREITLVVDHRARMSVGPAANTMLDYVREVALGIVGHAEAAAEPLGIVTVGADGLTNTMPASRRPEGYARIRELLLDIESTPTDKPGSSVVLNHPDSARRVASQLSGVDTEFANTLRQFTASTTAYTERIENDPLYGAVEYLQAASTTTQLTVILTTDRDRQQLREAVRAATTGRSELLVFLTPQILFESGELSDIEHAYDGYREFETFRAGLERLGSVVAYEVGPGDRLAAVLDSRSADTASRHHLQRQ